MDLKTSVESAEIQLKQILESFFISHYDENSLPSHGIDHHRRVWKNAAELLLFLAEKKLVDDDRLPVKLLIASYLHDIGMSVEKGVRHGRYSRELCNVFFSENGIDANSLADVLDAIENHDNKEYTTKISKYNLLSILSVADDLDAFGFSGIFRYAEIYLARGIDFHDLGTLIQQNAVTRYNNFVNTFGFLEDMKLKQKARLDILNQFYDCYNELAPSYEFKLTKPSGYCGVIEIFAGMSENKKVLKDIIAENLNRHDDSVMRWFFNGLASEIL
jgi:HD superfamily phosphodiesterase